MYVYAHINSGPFRLYDLAEIFYDGDIESGMLQIKRIRKSHTDRQVRQDLYRANKYEKPRQDVGVFYYLNFIQFLCICLVSTKQGPVITTFKQVIYHIYQKRKARFHASLFGQKLMLLLHSMIICYHYLIDLDVSFKRETNCFQEL